MFFFILLSIILLLFCIYLYLDNKKLKEKVIKLEKDTKEILERKITTNREKDLVSIKNISTDDSKSLLKETINIEKEQKPLTKINPEKKVSDKYTAKSNKEELVLKVSKPTTPALKQNKVTKYTLVENKIPKKQKMNKEQQFNVDDFVNNGERKKASVTNGYLNEIKNQLESDATPKTIELTEYEKNQEEQAVISYQELLSLKDKLKNSANEDNFLEDLKEFRKLLD